MNSAIGAAFGGLVVILLLLFSASTFYMVNSGRQLLCFDQPMRFAASRARRRRLRLCCHHGRRSRFGVGHRPAERHRAGQASDAGIVQAEGRAATMVTGVVALYLLAWIATGLAALVVGVMLYPKVNQTLADIGTTWLGLAV